MLWPLPFVSMRQEQQKPGLLPPFCTPRGDELVNNHLTGVGKVAKLRLPQHQSFRSMDAIAILKTQRTGLAQRTIIDRERCPRLSQMLKRSIRFTRCMIVQYRMTVTECATLRILPGETNRRTLGENCGKCQCLGLTPVNASFGIKGGRSSLQKASQLRVRSKSFRPLQ